MILVELKRGFGYLGAGAASKKLKKKLASAGVEADCYSEDGYVKIDVESIAPEGLANYIRNIIEERFHENGIQASCSAQGGSIQIDVQDIALAVLEKKVEEAIRKETGDSFWVEGVR